MRTNEELIADYRAGDADALNELAKQNVGLIASHANDWAKSRTDWDDVFQECSLAFLLAAHAFDSSRGRKFSTLASVAMNYHMNNLRVWNGAQKRTAKVERLHDGLKDREQTPAKQVELKLDAALMLKHIPQTRTRKVVWLSMQGWKNVEIAKRLHTTFANVSKIKRRGLRLLREQCLE